MNDDAFRKLAQNAALDQAVEGNAAFATMGAALYTTYVTFGVPASLAAELVRDWAYLHMRKALWPNEPPPARGSDE